METNYKKLVHEARMKAGGIKILFDAKESKGANDPNFWYYCFEAAKAGKKASSQRREEMIIRVPLPEDAVLFAPSWDRIIEVCKEQHDLSANVIAPIPEGNFSKCRPPIARHLKCKTKELRKDLSELCADCPLRDSIPETIEGCYIKVIRSKIELLPPNMLKEYFQSEMQKASEQMDLMLSISVRPINGGRGILTFFYIYNKEMLKALRVAQEEQPKQNISVETTPELVPTISLQRLEKFLCRSPMIGKMEFYRQVAEAELKDEIGVPSKEALKQRIGNIKARYSDFSTGKKPFEKSALDLIVNKLETEGKTIDQDFLNAVMRHSYGGT